MTMYRKFIPVALLIVAVGLASGCRNPFDPSADVRVLRFLVDGNDYYASIDQGTANSPTNAPQVVMVVVNYSTVPVEFTSYTVVYRQVGPQNSPTCPASPNSPICALGGATGRSYRIVDYMSGLTNTWASLPIRYTRQDLPLRVATDELMMYIFNEPATDIMAGGIGAYITIHGVDQNGHDVRASGTLHIEVY